MATAAAESPPPIQEKAPFSVALTTASAMALVPFSNFSISKTPIGPFHKMVFDSSTTLLKAAIEAHGRVGLMLNVRCTDLAAVLSLLPALQRPTVSSLSDADWVAVNTIIEERTVRELIPRLKAAGAQGIVEYPLNKIVL